MTRFPAVLALSLGLLASWPAPAQQPLTNFSCGTKTYSVPMSLRPQCSVTFTFSGVCDGFDLVTRWSQVISTALNGPVPAPVWQLKPWTTGDITIVGLDLMKLSGGPSLWWMVGNNHVTDIMLQMGANENRSGAHYAVSGSGWHFPGSATAPANAYLDLHGACSGGGPVQMALTVFYIPEHSVSTPPPPEPGEGVVFQATPDADSASFQGYTIVQRFDLAALTVPPGTPDAIEVTWQGAGAGLALASAHVCEAAAAGDPYDCAAPAVPLTVNGLSAAGSFAWTKTAPLLVRYRIASATQNRFKFKWSHPGAQGYYKAADDGNAADLTGYSTGAALLGISKIETSGF